MRLSRNTKNTAPIPVRLLSCLLLAGALPAQAAPLAPTPPDVDPKLFEQQFLKAEAACRKGGLTVQDRLRLNAALRLEYAAATDLLYLGCRAAVAPQEKACDLARNAGGMDPASPLALPFQESCASLQERADMIWAAVKNNDLSACQESLRRSSKKGPASPEDAAAICRAFQTAAKTGPGQLYCDTAVARGVPKSELQPCRLHSLYLNGQPSLCAKAPDDPASKTGINRTEKAICSELASLVAALRSGRPQDCAASPLCGALSTRKASACDPYDAKPAREGFCGAVAKIREGRTKEAARLDAAYKATLRKVEPVKDPQTAALRAKADEEAAAAQEAARKQQAAEAAKVKLIQTEMLKRREAKRKMEGPPVQLQKGQRLQPMPPEVKKRLEELEKKGQAEQPQTPNTGRTTP
jgi:hypothetical protein